MPIPTYRPAVSVTLFKNIDRQQGTAQRYQKANRTIDLTPYLGDATTIQIEKSIYEPAGNWSLSFGDQADPTTQDTLYSLIEPMDVVEIRGSSTAFKFAGARLPLLMRGFVSNVTRAEAMSGGTPQRTIIVSGQDWGKLWLIHGVWMEIALQQEEPLLTSFQLQAAIGMSAQLMTVGDFMQAVTEKVVNRKIQAMAWAQAPQSLPKFTCQSSVKQGLIFPQAVGTFSPGPFWNLVKAFSDSPWNELWIDDSDEQGPALVFRPTPFKTIDGTWIGDATDPGSIVLDAVDVTAMDVTRSDKDIANFFWTPPIDGLMGTPSMVAAGNVLAGVPDDFQHPNNEPSLYGLRKMEWSTRLWPGTLTDYPLKQTPDQQTQAGADITAWHVARGHLLRDMNRDNGVLEFGTIHARGREDFRPGKYLKLTRGKLTSEFYLSRIAHSITPFSSWQTSLTVERGLGFLGRNKMQGSPFWAEGRPGTYGRAAA
jgi:hypothetical protein